MADLMNYCREMHHQWLSIYSLLWLRAEYLCRRCRNFCWLLCFYKFLFFIYFKLEKYFWRRKNDQHKLVQVVKRLLHAYHQISPNFSLITRLDIWRRKHDLIWNRLIHSLRGQNNNLQILIFRFSLIQWKINWKCCKNWIQLLRLIKLKRNLALNSVYLLFSILFSVRKHSTSCL